MNIIQIRSAYAAALMTTAALGLISRLRPIGWRWYDKSLGDALYAVAVYLALGILFPRWNIALRLGLSLVFCAAVEALQLTGIPLRYSGVPGVRWLLGTAFAWHDLACYVVGALAAAAIDYVARSKKVLKCGAGRSIN